jgi:hypothetical protein
MAIIKTAECFWLLRKKGVTVGKTIDVLTATFCIENGFKLLHNNKVLEPMKEILGLQVKH